MKCLCLTLVALIFSFVSLAAIAPIGVDSVLCAGATASFSDSTIGGVWACSDTAIVNIDTSGTATGIAAGVVTITYTAGASFVTRTVTVHPAPARIIGPPFVCSWLGSDVLYINPTPGGGTWFLSPGGTLGSILSLDFTDTNSASVGGGGTSSGSGYLHFTDTAGCSTSIYILTIDYLAPITGDTVIYAGSASALHAGGSPSIGTWNSTNPSVATVDSTGLVAGVSAGTSTISYTLGCVVSATVTVLPPVSVPFLSETYNSRIALYPNPATSQLTITARNTITGLTVCNLLGQTVYTHDFNAKDVQVDVADLPAGLYFVKINGSEVRKFVKE